MSHMLPLDEPGRPGRSWACSAAREALEQAAALAVELRERLALLAPPVGAWPGWDERTVLADALAGLDALRAAVPELAAVRPWSEAEARDTQARVDRRALAAVRALEALVAAGRTECSHART